MPSREFEIITGPASETRKTANEIAAEKAVKFQRRNPDLSLRAAILKFTNNDKSRLRTIYRIIERKYFNSK